MLRIRLRRAGKKKQPMYRIVVADSRAPRDGAFVEALGYYHPLNNPSTIVLNEERAKHWLDHGAQPSDRLWRIGREIVAGDRHLHGVAIFKAKDVRAVTLDVFEAEPPPRHAAIRGWPRPESDPELAKARQKEMATAIAEHAQILLL